MPTALIVDDEPEANTLMAMLVQLRGYRTVSALTGEEAIAALGRDRFDLVFLDLMLPDISGFEVCRHIKSNRELALTPVVVVTARVAAENRAISFAQGADQFLPKPYTPDQIFDAIDEADAQRAALNRASRGGSFTLEVDEEAETLRRIAQLGSLLVARTPLPAAEVARLGDVLRSFFASAEAWGAAHQVNAVATLEYETFADRLEVRLLDRTGWLADWYAHPDREALDPPALASLSFESAETDHDRTTLTLVKRFPSSTS